jgi:hypothetical protein
MKREIMGKFPLWCNDNKTEYSLCLSNDMDSLFSCILLNKIKGYKIEYFYDFQYLYKTEQTKDKAIGVDIDLIDGRTWGNHVTLFKNENSANINQILNISRENYTEKYALSTLLTIISYYNFDISNLTEEAKMILLCIDAGFKGFYIDNFREKHIEYLKMLELEELIEIEKKHTIDDFYNLIDKYRLYAEIKINKKTGKLETSIDLAGLTEVFGLPFLLPNDYFFVSYKFDSYITNLNLITKEKLKQENIFSLALVNKDTIKYSKFRN